MAVGKQVSGVSTLVQFCNWAKKNGYRVGEMHGFSVVHPVHMKNSWHYDKDAGGWGKAADINFGVNGAAERAKLIVAMHYARSLGLAVIFAWQGTVGVASGHQNHLHTDVGPQSNIGKGLIGATRVGVPAGITIPGVSTAVATKRKPRRLAVLSQGKRRGSWQNRVWQQYLRSQGYKIAADKIFGAATAKATKSWQRSRGLVADGIVGIASWSGAVSGIRLGSKGPAVEIWQNIVGLVGKDADSIFGIATVGRSKEVQRWLGVTPDAWIGTNTITAYRKKA